MDDVSVHTVNAEIILLAIEHQIAKLKAHQYILMLHERMKWPSIPQTPTYKFASIPTRFQSKSLSFLYANFLHLNSWRKLNYHYLWLLRVAPSEALVDSMYSCIMARETIVECRQCCSISITNWWYLTVECHFAQSGWSWPAGWSLSSRHNT